MCLHESWGHHTGQLSKVSLDTTSCPVNFGGGRKLVSL